MRSPGQPRAAIKQDGDTPPAVDPPGQNDRLERLPENIEDDEDARDDGKNHAACSR